MTKEDAEVIAQLDGNRFSTVGSKECCYLYNAKIDHQHDNLFSVLIEIDQFMNETFYCYVCEKCLANLRKHEHWDISGIEKVTKL